MHRNSIDPDGPGPSTSRGSGPRPAEDVRFDFSMPRSYVNNEESKLRRKLRFFFMNPIEKWKHKRKFPFKFLIQIIKIFLVTFQSCLFAHHRYFYINFVAENRITFSHLFVNGWDTSREVVTYPPQSGDLAIYKKNDFFLAIDYAANNYASLNEAIGAYFYTQPDGTVKPLKLCIRHYDLLELFSYNDSYSFKNSIKQKCLDIVIEKDKTKNFSSKAYLKEHNFDIDFAAFVEGFFYFSVKTINLMPPGPIAKPDCYMFNLSLWFNGKGHDGKVKMSLLSPLYRISCNGSVDFNTNSRIDSFLHSFLSAFVTVWCISSLFLCCRALYRAQLLRRKTERFFEEFRDVKLTFAEKVDFINFWYVTMIISDIIVIIGSILKGRIEMNQFSGDEWNICSVMLGTGTFLIWVCILRYLGFFKAYNFVILTLHVAAPMVLRFLTCAALIFAGFALCGWLVLGPYHEKFRTLSVTIECLFALLNGDDVFDTFITLEPTESVLVWTFCRFYLYFFVFLFIYVIISLFISIILDAFETIKKYYTNGFPKNYVKTFMESEDSGEAVSASSSVDDDLVPCMRINQPVRLDCIANTICCVFPPARHEVLES